MSLVLVAMSPSGDGVIIERNGELFRSMHGGAPGTGPVVWSTVIDAVARGGYLRIDEPFPSMDHLSSRVDEIVRAHTGSLVASPALTVERVRTFMPRLYDLAASASTADEAIGRALRYLKVEGVKGDAALRGAIDGAIETAWLNRTGPDSASELSAANTAQKLAHARWASIAPAAA